MMGMVMIMIPHSTCHKWQLAPGFAGKKEKINNLKNRKLEWESGNNLDGHLP